MRVLKKKGISLVVLTITLILMSILATTIVMSLDNSLYTSKEVGFATELKEITEGAQTYYLLNKELPIDKSTSFTKIDLLGIAEDSAELQNEISLNQDISAVYYKIDMNLIASSDSLYGNGSSTYDFYVISQDGNFVYYPLGVKVGDNVYYSLTSKLSQITDVSLSDSTAGDVTSIITTTKISVIKSTEMPTKSLTLTVNTTLDEGEKLYYVLGDTKTQITSLPYALELSEATLSSEQKDISKVVFQKENSSQKVIAKTYVDITNLEITDSAVQTQ